MMRAYFLLFACLLPHLAFISDAAHHQNHRHQPQRILLRRSSRNPLRISSSPRHIRLSRFIQDQQQQEHDVQQQQDRGLEDADIDSDIEQLMNQAFGQPPLRPIEQFSTPSTQSNGGNGLSQIPQQHRYEPMTAQKPMQLKEDDLSPISQAPSHQSLDSDGFDMDLPQKFIPQSQDIQSYAPGQQQERQQQLPQQQQQRTSGGKNGKGNRMNGYQFLSDDGDFGSESDFIDESEGFNTIDGLKDVVRGEPGKDYPILSEIPVTSFKCSDQQYPGYYADIEAQCQVFHICQPDGRHNAFLCPNATIFSQRHFVCVWWYEFDCAESEAYFGLNADLYKEPVKQVDHSPIPPTPVESARAHGGGGFSPGSGPSRTTTPGMIYSGSPGPSFADTQQPITGHQYSTPRDQQISQMYQNQIDGFGMDQPMTTVAPTYYSPSSMPSSKSIGNSGYAGRTTPKLMSRYEPSSYGGKESIGVTASPLQDSYETTPYNLDAALGEEIHSETPLIESLPLTTILPHVEQAVDMAIANRKTKNGFGKSTLGKFYGTKNNGVGNGNGFSDRQFSNGNGGRPKPSYGGTKGGNNGKQSKYLSPMKNGANGGNGSGGGSIPSQLSYGGNNAGYGSANGQPSSPSSVAKKTNGSYKPFGSSSSYGTKI